MPQNVSQKLIASHLVEGKMIPGEGIGLKIDQTLTQDATGTLVMLELEAMGLSRVKTELSAQYVDHNLLQTDFKNPDDHIFLRSACQKFGLWYSRAGNGVSHPIHMERFGIPGKTLLGSDSHTPAAGALGMLAMGAGGLEVAMAMAGKPYHIRMPKILGVKLMGELPPFVSAKDVILEMLRRYGVEGGIGRIIEYYGPGLASLDAMSRHVIANMGTELGATTSVFPADDEVKRFLKQQQREVAFEEIVADENATYDEMDEIDLSTLVPLIAKPSSPGNVVPVREVAGEPVFQCMIGSSANPGYRDFAIAAAMIDGKQVHNQVSFDVNPTSRQILENLTRDGWVSKLLAAGARIHESGCNGCIGMGQAPASDKNSLRTVPRNFPGRSGTKEDKVFLCSPETATASALMGVITDPRDLGLDPIAVKEPESIIINTKTLEEPPRIGEQVSLVKGPNIKPLPEFLPLSDTLEGPVLMKMGDDISTDEIMPAGSRVLPFRSNIPEIAKFVYTQVDETYYDRAMEYQESGHFIVAGHNYGQGSSREHAAIAPRYLGLSAVIAKGYARIHAQNLVNFGILPLLFANESDYETIEQGDVLELKGIRKAIVDSTPVSLYNKTKEKKIPLQHDLNDRERELVIAGGIIAEQKQRGAT